MRVPLLACALLAWHGLRKKSLSPSGAAAACLIGMATFSNPRPVFTAALLAFYLSGSLVTRIGSKTKFKLEEGYKQGGQRTAIQVLANGLTGAMLSLFHMIYTTTTTSSAAPLCFSLRPHGQMELVSTCLTLAYLAHYACCLGDTFASELGVLSKSWPFLITTWKRVPPGVNGGVSLLGTVSSIAGGLLVGLTCAVAIYFDACKVPLTDLLVIVCVGGLAGFTGSLIDSLLGATLQKSTYNKKTQLVAVDFRVVGKEEDPADFVWISGFALLDNHQVNYLSSLATAGIIGLAGFLLCS